MKKKFMRKGNGNKILIVSVILLLVLLVGVSYAAYDYSFLGKESKLESGSVSIKFLESNTNVISLKNSLPEADSIGKKDSNTFDFSVTSKASYDTSLKYTLSIEKLSVDTGYTSFNDNQVKLYLTDYSDNSLVEPTLISNLDNNVLYEKANNHSKTNSVITDKYKLRVWINNSVDASSWDQNTKLSYKFKLNVKSSESSLELDGVDTLISKEGKDGLVKVVHSANNTLQIGASEDLTEYRYTGANPNNYVSFNNEVWRIIGVFPSEGSDGSIKNRIKLIRSEALGSTSWNNSNGLTGVSSGSDSDSGVRFLVGGIPGKEGDSCDGDSNDWSKFSLKSYFDSTYYKSISDNSIIDKVKYYLGGFTMVNNTKSDWYSYERNSSDSYYYSSNSKNVYGYIALMYLSDYGYAASDSCSDTLGKYNSDSCKSNNWLFLGSEEYTLSNSYNNGTVVSIKSDGSATGGICASENHLVRPVLYLKPDVKIIGCNGTSSNPYVFR